MCIRTVMLHMLCDHNNINIEYVLCMLISALLYAIPLADCPVSVDPLCPLLHA